MRFRAAALLASAAVLAVPAAGHAQGSSTTVRLPKGAKLTPQAGGAPSPAPAAPQDPGDQKLFNSPFLLTSNEAAKLNEERAAAEDARAFHLPGWLSALGMIAAVAVLAAGLRWLARRHGPAPRRRAAARRRAAVTGQLRSSVPTGRPAHAPPPAPPAKGAPPPPPRKRHKAARKRRARRR